MTSNATVERNIDNLQVQIQGLSFSYDETEVLKEITLDLHQGEFIGLIGPNGSGKSTLLKLMGGLIKGPKNSINFESNEIQSYSKRELAQKIAWVPQETSTPFSFSAHEMVMMGRHPYLSNFRFEGLDDQALCQAAMETTSTLHLANREFRELSGGEQQRVLIASAIVQSPEVMLLDEPTSSLDLKYQLQILEILERLNTTQEMSQVVAMHDLNLASRYCRRLILLKEGRIVCDGTPDEVLKKEILEDVYEVRVQVLQSAERGYTLILPEGL